MSQVDAVRYLVSFNLDDIPRVATDVCVIGGGVAGLAAAATAAAGGADVTIVSKTAVEETNTRYAQGGIAVALDPTDTAAMHAHDTIRAGQGLCDEEMVELVISEGIEAVGWLIGIGAEFAMEDGRYVFTREGGHEKARILHAGDETGAEIERALVKAVRGFGNVRIVENAFAVDIVTVDGRAVGALLMGTRGKAFVSAQNVILATGGSGCLYRETTNPRIATSDGLAMAFRAGAKLVDLEFFQFHPTTLYIAGADRFLISEAVRGEGAILRNKAGARFMPEYHEAAELAPRDVVSRALVEEMRKTGHPNVYLDLSHLRADFVLARFPMISRIVKSYDLDLTRDQIPVRPSAHYLIGGIKIDRDGRTNVPALLAAGECACNGFHGANRLGSNSLLEALVLGRRAGKTALGARPPDVPLNGIQHRRKVSERQIRINDVTNSVRALMWKNVGIVRNAVDLGEALRAVEYWSSYVLDMEFHGVESWELQNMLIAAHGVIRAALRREESRGAHYRSDFPLTDDDNFRHHIYVQRNPVAAF